MAKFVLQPPNAFRALISGLGALVQALLIE
jgi:hypothetical protein